MSEYPPASRAAYPVIHAAATRWRDDDVYGHMNNVVYYEYFDTTVNRWLIENNVLEIPNGPLIGLVAETSCKYLSGVGFPDLLDIGLSTMRVGGSSVVYGLALFARGEDTAAALCRYVHVYVDAETRRPSPLPVEMRAALTAIAVGAGGGAAGA